MEHRQVQIYTNYEKIILKFVVLSIALARSDTILLVSLTRLKKGFKTYNFRIKSDMPMVYKIMVIHINFSPLILFTINFYREL